MKEKIVKNLTYLFSLIGIIIFPLNLTGYINVSSFLDFILFIDPGHGGWDNGAYVNNVYEDEINLSIGEKLFEICLKKNMMAYISRSSDYDLASNYAKNRKSEDLLERSEKIAHSGCNAFVSIHVNQYPSSSVHGPMVYFEKDNDNSYSLASFVQKELNVVSNMDKKIHVGDFYLFRKCETPGIFVECGFISNEEERKKLLNEQYQLAISQAIYQGVYNYYLSQ